MRGKEVHGNEPLHKREVAVLKDCADPAREIMLAKILSMVKMEDEKYYYQFE